MSGYKDDPSGAGLIWHYAGLEAVKGILETGEIWLQETTYMNDHEELKHTWKVARDCAIGAARMSAGQDPKNRADAAAQQQHVQQSGTRVAAVLDEPRLENVFLASFSRSDDLLSQWRAYCPRGGASLGFDRRLLEQHLRPACVILRDCFYGDVTQKRHDEDPQPKGYPAKLYQELYSHATQINHAIMQGFPPNFSQIFEICALYKKPMYSEEKETRAVFVQSDSNRLLLKVRVRVLREHLVRYVALKWDSVTENPLKFIRLAPCASREALAMTDAIRLLSSECAPAVTVRRSEQPL